MAVDIPELRNHPDVVFLSIQGTRRAADYLAGGNYFGVSDFTKTHDLQVIMMVTKCF
jgi:hypothetical protein